MIPGLVGTSDGKINYIYFLIFAARREHDDHKNPRLSALERACFLVFS